MKYSIVIPIYNGEFLRYQLETLSLQDFPKENFEVIYADDGSDENYVEQYKELFSKYPDLQINHCYLGDKRGRFRVQEVRNFGAANAKNENIIFIDADCLFPHYYLSNLEKIVAETGYEIILGHSIGYNTLPDCPSIIPEDIVRGEHQKYKNDSRFADFRTEGFEYLWQVFIGGNIYIKKYLLESVGGWDNNIASWGGGDIDLGYRLWKTGYGMHFLEGIEVYNIKDEERINARKTQSFMKNQCYLLDKYKGDRIYRDYVMYRYNHIPLEYKIGQMFSEFRERFFPKKKLIFYCSSQYGRGHFMRTLKIYNALKQDYDIRIIFSGKITEEYLDGIDYMWVERGTFSTGNMQEIRDIYFRDFIPDIFLVDFFPFGKIHSKDDIDFLISLTKDNNGKVYTYMRDLYDGREISIPDTLREDITSKYKSADFQEVLGYAYHKKQMKFLSKLLLEDYLERDYIDGIWIFGDENIFDFASEYQLERFFREKIQYLGYFLDDKPQQRKKVFTQKIIVSSGGGFHNKKAFLLLIKYLSKFPHLQVYFFPGDDLSRAEKYTLQQYVSAFTNIFLKDFSQEYYEILGESDIAFIAGGYNSFCDVFQYNIPCYVLGYGQGNISVETNIFEIEARLKALEHQSDIHRFYDFDFKKLQKIIQYEYNNGKRTAYSEIKNTQISTIQQYIIHED